MNLVLFIKVILNCLPKNVVKAFINGTDIQTV